MSKSSEKLPVYNPNRTQELPIRFGWKLMRVARQYRQDTGYCLLTPFKSIDGSRFVAIGEAKEATVRWGGEGGTRYWTGFHIIPDLGYALEYVQKFKRPGDFVLCAASVAHVFEKPTNRRVGLAGHMRLLGPYVPLDREEALVRDYYAGIMEIMIPENVRERRAFCWSWLREQRKNNGRKLLFLEEGLFEERRHPDFLTIDHL